MVLNDKGLHHIIGLQNGLPFSNKIICTQIWTWECSFIEVVVYSEVVRNSSIKSNYQQNLTHVWSLKCIHKFRNRKIDIESRYLCLIPWHFYLYKNIRQFVLRIPWYHEFWLRCCESNFPATNAMKVRIEQMKLKMNSINIWFISSSCKNGFIIILLLSNFIWRN